RTMSLSLALDVRGPVAAKAGPASGHGGARRTPLQRGACASLAAARARRGGRSTPCELAWPARSSGNSRRSAPLADDALRGNRETELERGAATQRGVHTDRSTEHLLRDLTDDRQSRARARAELLGGETRLKDPLQMLGGDPHAFVLDCQAQRLAHLLECDQDGRVPLPGRRHRIAD